MPDSWDDLMGGPPAATAERVDSWDQLLGGPPVQARPPEQPPIESSSTSTRGSSPAGPDMFDLRSSDLGPMPSRPRPRTAYQDVARAYNASGAPEASGSLGVFGRTAIPFGSSAAQLVETGAHSAAQQRARAGEASPEDYALLRNYPRQRREEQEHPWASGLGGVTSFVGEAAGGGTLVKGIGAGAKSLLARVAGGVGRAAATTAVMPATYANWAQKNEGEGRDPFDLSTLPTNVAYGTMQQAVLGTVGKLAGKIPGEGVSGALGRFGARFTGGMAEMNAVDAAAGKVSEYLPDAMKLRTGYGAFSDLLKEKDGALREFVLQGLTIGAFSAAHGIGEATEQSKQNRRARAEATVEAMRESLDNLSRKGYSKGLAAETLQPAIDALREAAEQDLPPDLSKLPDGPAKELAEKVAEQLPKAATAASSESPDSPEPAGELPHEEVPGPQSAAPEVWKAPADMAEAHQRWDAGEEFSMEHLYDAAKLTSNERYVLGERVKERTHEDIAKDEDLRKPNGKRYGGRAAIEAIEKRARNKLGMPDGMSFADLFKQNAPEAVSGKEDPLKGFTMSAKEAAGPEAQRQIARAKRRSSEDVVSEALGMLADEYESEADRNGGEVSNERHEAIRAQGEQFRSDPQAAREYLKQASVRRAAASKLPGGVQPDAAADQGTRPPAEGVGQGADTAASGEAPGNELAFNERMARGQAENRFPEVFARAREMGLDTDHVHQLARETYDTDKAGADEHNDWLKAAKIELKSQGMSMQKIARVHRNGGDVALLPGMDTAAESLFRRRPDLLHQGEHATDGLARILLEGKQQPESLESHYDKALEHLQELNRAAHQTDQAVRLEARRVGAEGYKAAEIAEAIRAGETSSLREGVEGEGEYLTGGEAEGAEGERPEVGAGSVPAEVAPGVHFFGGPGQPGGQPGGTAGQPGGSPGRGTAGGSLSQAVAAPIDAKAAGRAVLRPEIARKQRRADVAAAALDKGEKFFQSHIEAQSPDVQKQRFLDFYVPIETGRDVPAEQKPFADTYKDLKGDYTKALVDNGLIESTIANHVGHLYRDPRNPNATPESIMASILGRRPLTGGEGFRRERRGDLPTWQEAIDAGFEPRSWNPMTQAKMEFDQYSKSLFGHAVFDQFKEQGLAVYTRLGQRPPEGMSQVEDKLFRVLAPGEARVKEYFDKQQTEGLEKFAADNKIKIRTAMTGPIGQQTPGEVVRRFGTPEEVLMHEIGHELEHRYGLDTWAKNPSLQPELEKLADLRSSGRTSPQQAASLRDPSEWVANLFAGYLHAPELTQKVAPNAFALLDSFLSSHKETAPLRNIKPSLELGERDQNLRLAGPMLTGHYYLPDAVAKDTNNYMSPGLSSVQGPGGSVYRAFRGFGNHMTQFLLGVSGFHAVETAIYAQASAAAEAGNMALRGDFKKAAGKALEAAVPLLAPSKAVAQGSKMRAEWDMPGSQSPEIQEMVKNLELAGGRARGGSDYMTNSLAQASSALRRIGAGDFGQIPRALLHALPGLNEAAAKPTMDKLVPLVKMGVFGDAAKYELAKMPDATPTQKAEVLRKIWDQMDDRFGLVTHDNLFWNRVMRDVVHTSFLSFGWNMGDVRGLGGGLVDALRPSQWQGLAKGEGISRRTGFLIAMMGTTAAYGALYQLAATGKPPEEPKDLWFPKTGRQGKDGTPERMAFPTNMKDLANSVNRASDSPLQIPRNIYGMAKGKLSPAVKLVGDILENRDWSNSMIDNPNETWVRQGKDLGMHILSAFEPIGVKQFFDQRKKGAGVGQQLQGFAGITPAPYGISHTDEQLRAMERNKNVELTPLQKKVRKGR